MVPRKLIWTTNPETFPRKTIRLRKKRSPQGLRADRRAPYEGEDRAGDGHTRPQHPPEPDGSGAELSGRSGSYKPRLLYPVEPTFGRRGAGKPVLRAHEVRLPWDPAGEGTRGRASSTAGRLGDSGPSTDQNRTETDGDAAD